MGTTRVIADLHFSHPNISKWRGIDDHDEWLIDQWNSVVAPRDTVWVLGDVAMRKDGIEKVEKLNGIKNLVFGNHDVYSIRHYEDYFNKFHGFMYYKGFIFSHAPIAKEHLRGRLNIHGHTHSRQMFNDDYICVCVEALDGKPIEVSKLRDMRQSVLTCDICGSMQPGCCL